MSVDGGAFGRWLSKTSETSALVNGKLGHTYAFYTVATDLVGHLEDVPEEPDAVTMVLRPGDADLDGDVDLGDIQVFMDCMGGVAETPSPVLPRMTPDKCLDLFDFGADHDVDLADFARLQKGFVVERE